MAFYFRHGQGTVFYSVTTLTRLHRVDTVSAFLFLSLALL